MYYMASLHHIHSVLFQSSQGTAIDDSVQPGGSRSLFRFLWRIWIALGQLRLDLPEPSRCRECLGRGPQLLCFCFMNQSFQVVKRLQQKLPFESLIPLPSTLPSHCYEVKPIAGKGQSGEVQLQAATSGDYFFHVGRLEQGLCHVCITIAACRRCRRT